jgi:cytosine/adenosine deaminase-related metal-dependent hydrolase
VIVVRARWILPIAERPLLNGWFAVERGRIAAVGRSGAALPFRDDAPLVDLGPMAVLPALTNAHVHLELSWMAGRVPRRDRFTSWVRKMLQVRRGAPPPDDVVIRSIEEAIVQARATGTGLVGDISNSLLSVGPLRQSSLGGVVFHELLKLTAADADNTLEAGLAAVERCGPSPRVPVSLAPHAPYSVSPRLFQGIRAAQARTPFLPSSVHLGESREEIELLESGHGPWRELLEELGAWDTAWVPPAMDPAAYLDRMRILGPHLLAVHGVHLSDPALERLAARGTTLVTCPRSNAYVGVGDPPIDRFYRAGVAVAVGTDSLASNDDLNMFSELAAIRGLGSSVPAASLLASATWQGARALGFESESGTIEPGRSASLIAVDLPQDVVDVEEYLVSGVTADKVHWVEDLIGDCGLRPIESLRVEGRIEGGGLR